MYSINQRVSLKNNIKKKGTITYVHMNTGGFQFYDVIFDDGDSSSKNEMELCSEIIIKTPWDLLAENSFSDYQNYSLANTLHKIKNTTTNTLSTLKASRTIFKPYQYLPLIKILKSSNKRILVADEVGLGKTIEAGHILLELSARSEVRNCLIVCTKALSLKWKTELQEKFNFNFKVYDTTNELIKDLENDIHLNKKSIFGIVNYEKFRNEQLQELILNNGYGFDLIVADEAHRLRNKNKQYQGFKKSLELSSAAVFMTATPIMTDLKNLYNLLHLLDSSTFFEYQIFFNAIEINKPFIKALNKLNNNSSLIEIKQDLENTKIGQFIYKDKKINQLGTRNITDIFSGDKLFSTLMSDLNENNYSINDKVKIQQKLIELNSLNYIYSRTRKKDVLKNTDIIKRNAKRIIVNISEQEMKLYEELMYSYNEDNHLALIQQKRQISSSIVAFFSNRKELENGIYNKTIFDSKYHRFNKLISEYINGEDNKIVVFAFFTNTLLYLKCKLLENGIKAEIIYGDIKNRDERIEKFKNDSSIKVLLSSEVGSEGLDLQFCNSIINYDLPWNPMVVEQRIGRIDRIGQKSPVVNIYNLFLANTIEERIYYRLYERIKLFEQSIGALEEILGDNIDDNMLIEKQLNDIFINQLTLEQENEKLDQIALAIETEKIHLEKINSELTDSLTNDAYFKNELDVIEKNKRYLTGNELLIFIKKLIKEAFAYVRFNSLSEDDFELIISKNDKKTFYEFLKNNLDSPNDNNEINELFRKFLINTKDKDSIHFTLNQEVAYSNSKIEYLSFFHPIINSGANYFISKSYDKNQANNLSLNKKYFTKTKIDEGYYILVNYEVVIEKNQFGKIISQSILRSSIVDLNLEEISFLDTLQTDEFISLINDYSERFNSNIELNKEIIDLIRTPISLEISRIETLIYSEQKLVFESFINRKKNQEIEFIDYQLEQTKQLLIENKGIERINLKKKSELLAKKDELISLCELSMIKSNNKLISINLVEIK